MKSWGAGGGGPAGAPPAPPVLVCHGNGGNVSDRVPHIAFLTAAGFDVLAFDYRGYGRSTGRPGEAGTYLDARAARRARPGRAASDRVLYLGESLGAAVALELAHHHPPAGLILQSPFTSIRDMARLHYPFIPRALVPDAYPSLRLIATLDVPLLVLHGDRDEIVPAMHGEALYDAATSPKRLEIRAGAGHNDLVGPDWASAISRWALSMAA
jgi:uncharacterized protein